MQAERSLRSVTTTLTRPHSGRTRSAVVSSATSTEADTFVCHPPTAEAVGYAATAPTGLRTMALAPYVNPIGQLHTTSFLSIPGPNPHVYDTIFRQAYQKKSETRAYKKSSQLSVNCLITSDPGEARTLDPMIKSHLLYQLSYGVIR